jgi:hypothetical protein
VAAPFVIYPSIPGEPDLLLLLEAAAGARAAPRGIWTDDQTLLAYEYRAGPQDVSEAVSRLDLAPSPRLVGAV